MKKQLRLCLSVLVFTFFCVIAGGSFTGELAFDIGCWVVVVAIIAAIVISINRDTKHTNMRRTAIDKIKQESDFKSTVEFVDPTAEYWVGVNDTTEEIKILLLDEAAEKINEHLIKFANIISVEFVEDGERVYSKSAMRTIGGAAIGGVLAGGAGAIVGGLSGDSKEKTVVSKVEVKLLLRDYDKTTIIIGMHSGTEIKKSSSGYKLIYDNAMMLIDKFKVIIDKMDRYSAQSNSVNIQDVLSEIDRLYELKLKGAITDDEFQQLKHKYLGSKVQ